MITCWICIAFTFCGYLDPIPTPQARFFKQSSDLAALRWAVMPSAVGAKYLNLQHALHEYGKAGWQLVTHSFFPNRTGGYSVRLIFMSK